MKKLLVILSLSLLLVCLLAICVSAETSLKPQTSDAYGELSFFDESISVGRTDNKNGFSPYIDEAGTAYARVVIGDGTTFYTFPTAYMYSSSKIYGSNGKTLWSYDLASLNSAMETVTKKNPNWTIGNVYRIELPYNTNYLNGDKTQKFQDFSNVIEIHLQPNTTTIDTGTNINCLFHSCRNLTTIHNIDSFVFKHNNNLGGAFQNCSSLTSLTLGPSPAITKINSSMFNSCTKLESVNIFEAFPNAKEFGASAFENCYKLKSLSATRKDGVIVFPERFSYFENNVFKDCDSITAIKFTGSNAKFLQSTFHSLNSLEYLYFPKSSKLEIPSCEVFSNNEKLKAVAFPDNCTVIPDRGFKNCKSLKAVYLPANLEEIMTNGGDQGAFAYDREMYFVNDWFNVLDEDGNFLFDSFLQPEKPEVYYFPSTLTKFYTRDGGTGFRENFNLNPVMVLPTGVTKLWVYDGCFYDCGIGSNNAKFTIVLLGDMTDVRINVRDNRAKGVSYVFANKNDTDLSSLTFVDTSDRACYSMTDETFYFCSTGKTYKLSQWAVHPDPTSFTYTTENRHIVEPKATVVTQKATCVLPELSTKYCFCGKDFETIQTADALGHDFNEIPSLIVYENGNFFVNGTATHSCLRENCNECEEKIASPIFIAKGFSRTEADVLGNAIMQDFTVNTVSLKAYTEYGEYEVASYGIIAVATIGENSDVIDAQGNYSNLVNGETKGSYTMFGDTNYAEITARVKNIGANVTKLIYTNLCVVLKDRETGTIDAVYSSINEGSVVVDTKLHSAISYENIVNEVK